MKLYGGFFKNKKAFQYNWKLLDAKCLIKN
jgi:hypothetical protein